MIFFTETSARSPRRERTEAVRVWSTIAICIVALLFVIRDLMVSVRVNGVALSQVSLGRPLASAAIEGKARFTNLLRSPIRLHGAGETHVWLEWSERISEQPGSEVAGRFRPCDEAPAHAPLALNESVWWCFRQISPTLGEQDIAAAASNILASRLWLTILITYEDGEAQLHHSRYRLVYNFETGTPEPAKEKAVWFD